MKKISILLSLFMLAFSSMQAQYWQIPNITAGTNPGGLNTDVEEPLAAVTGWTSILATSATPTWSPTQTLPFAFQFNGAAVTQYKVSSTGVLTFDVATALAAPALPNAALPSALIPNKSVVCAWGLQGSGANDNIVIKTFGTAPNRQQWIQFSSYSSPADAAAFCYWAVVLDETTNIIHIVDQRSASSAALTLALTAGIQVDAATAYSVPSSPALNSTTTVSGGSGDTPSDNTYYSFVPGTQAAYDMSVTAITNQVYVSVGNVSVTGTIRNLGTTPITSLTINYKIDGGTAVSSPLTGLNIASFASYSFTCPTPWSATTGTHTIQAYATLLNGSNPDANLYNDSKTKSVSVLSETIQRLPLFEVFTSSTCAPCKAGNENYTAIVSTKPAADYVDIKYQQDFPGTGDPYCTTEAVNRRGFYAINSIPRMEIDGGWDGNASSFTSALYDAARAIPAQYKMSGTYGMNNKAYTAKVRFSPLFNATGAKLYVAILENKTVKNVKSNGETEFHDVLKKMLPNENGTAVPAVTIGNWDSLTFNFTFNGNYRLPADGAAASRIVDATEHSVENFYNMHVIAWIQGSDKQVYQAVNLTSNTPVGTEDFSTTVKNIDVYPNPTSDVININMNMTKSDVILATLVDLSGNMVESKSINANAGTNTIQFNTKSLAQGIYNVLIFDSKNNSSVHKIVVQH